jgi:hypothetical protein
MNKTIRRLMIGSGILVGALVVLMIGIGLFFDVNRYRPQIENAVAKATGMSLKINGKASLKMFPVVRVRLEEVHLSNGGSEFFVARELEIAPRLIPFLLRRQVMIGKVSLVSPKISVEKSPSGRLNFETAGNPAVPGSSAGTDSGSAPGTAPGEVRSIGITNGDFAYKDRSTGQSAEITGLNVDLSGISWNTQPADTKDMMNSISFHGGVEADSFKVTTKTGTTAASKLKATLRDDHGLVRVDSTEVSIFGGMARGDTQIDLRSGTPKIEITQNASGIDLAQAAPQLKTKLSGSVDISVRLTGSGKDVQALTKTMSGTLSIHSQNIATNVDVDGLAAKLKTAQGMDLVGIGSSIFSSPLGQAAASQAAGIAGGAPPPKTAIRNLVSDWNINNGIAEAKDVAIATAKTTVAFKGDLNLIDKKYQNFYIATVDQKGCAKNKVEVGGPLSSPRPVAGSMGKQLSESYLGSASSALGSAGSQIAGIFGGKAEPKSAPKGRTNLPPKEVAQGCDEFYSGSVMNAG